MAKMKTNKQNNKSVTERSLPSRIQHDKMQIKTNGLLFSFCHAPSLSHFVDERRRHTHQRDNDYIMENTNLLSNSCFISSFAGDVVNEFNDKWPD